MSEEVCRWRLRARNVSGAVQRWPVSGLWVSNVVMLLVCHLVKAKRVPRIQHLLTTQPVLSGISKNCSLLKWKWERLLAITDEVTVLVFMRHFCTRTRTCRVVKSYFGSDQNKQDGEDSETSASFADLRVAWWTSTLRMTACTSSSPDLWRPSWTWWRRRRLCASTTPQRFWPLDRKRMMRPVDWWVTALALTYE